jgi:SAM-dependent methyltransferase
MNVPSLKQELKQLITRALQEKYVSESSQEKIQTGNNYQSVWLGDEKTNGFRALRDDVLDTIPFSGKRVLDLGANLGEVSRAAHRRGATQVDGFEYDPYFVEIANLVSAYNDVTRVSFFQRDITDQSAFKEEYDIVLAFSVFVYIDRILPKIRAVTRELFILETHQLTDNFESVYLKAILPYFPYHKILGETDWGTNKGSTEKRVVVAFAHDQKYLAAIGGRPDKLSDGEPGQVRQLDLRNSEFQFLRSFSDKFPQTKYQSLNELLSFLNEIDLTIEDASQLPEYFIGLSGWVYWYFFLKGYHNYKIAGDVLGDDIYCEYLKKYFSDINVDPELKLIIDDDAQLTHRVALRYQILTRFNEEQSWTAEPLSVIDIKSAEANVALRELGKDIPFTCRALDGYHRIFCAKIINISKAPFVLI